MKYVIVGNGIVGLSVAFRLSQRLTSSDRIEIIGPKERPGCASLAAGAMLNSFGEIDVCRLKSDVDFYHFELSHMAAQLWPTFEEELVAAVGEHLPSACEKCEIVRGGGCFGKGTFIVNNCAADEWDDRNFEAIIRALDDFDEPHEMVSPREIPNYFPSQNLRATKAVFIHDEGWLNPYILLEKIDAIMQNSELITVVDATATKLRGNHRGVESVVLNDGREIEGDRFLVATGATAGELLARSELGLNIQPVFYGVGFSMEIQSPENPHINTVRTPNRGGACGTYTVPYFKAPNQMNDHILIGASNRVQPEPSVHERIGSIQHLMNSAIEEINGNFYKARLIHWNLGWRPTTQDTFPLLGRTSITNLFVATGTKRDGFHLAPVLSDYMAKILMDKEVDDRFKWFAPERPLIRELSREEAVEMTVGSLMSEQYQHGYRPSCVPMNRQVIETYRRDIEELHDKVGATDWGIPPLMVNMYRDGYAK